MPSLFRRDQQSKLMFATLREGRHCNAAGLPLNISCVQFLKVRFLEIMCQRATGDCVSHKPTYGMRLFLVSTSPKPSVELS